MNGAFAAFVLERDLSETEPSPNATELTSRQGRVYTPVRNYVFDLEGMMMLARKCLVTIFLVALAALPRSAGAQTRALKKINVGVPAISMGNIIIFFTKEAKIYEKHGLDAEARRLVPHLSGGSARKASRG